MFCTCISHIMYSLALKLVVWSTSLFFLASLGLTSTTRGGARGSFIGYSASGLPLYNFTNSALHQTSRSILMQAGLFLKQIVADHNSRRIFYFLCLNLSKLDCWTSCKLIAALNYIPSHTSLKFHSCLYHTISILPHFM